MLNLKKTLKQDSSRSVGINLEKAMNYQSFVKIATLLFCVSGSFLKPDTLFGADPVKESEVKDVVNLGGLNLMSLEMKKLLPKLAEWTGKVIIPVDSELERLKLTLYSKKQHTRKEILKHIYSALNQKGFIIEETEDEILIKKAEDSKIGIIPTIGDETPLISIEDQTRIVQKVFKLKVYSPSAMRSLLLGMKKSDKTFKIISDENTNTLIVIDTVSSLIGIETIIDELDIPEADQTISETIEIAQGDPLEIVQLLKILLTQVDEDSKSRSRYSSSSSKGLSINFTGPSLQPIVLVPIVNQNWIIAKASSEDMKLIKDWIVKLDISDSEELEQEMVSVQYLDVNELASRLNAGLQQQPGVSSQPEVVIQPLDKAKKILLFGSTKSRERIKRFISELDIPSDNHVSKRFDLKYADPDQVKTYLEELFTEEENKSYYSRYSTKKSETGFLRVISNALLKQVTVITSLENMNKIETQILEWDTPLNLDNVKPLILTLKNSDPEKMVDLLSTLFTDTDDGGGSNSWWFWGGKSDEKEKIVGALYGKLSFAAVPDTKKIVIISKIPEAYKVVQEIIEELDSEDMAELPQVIVLKYADAEELADQLNALLNERGTEATLKRRIRGLSPSSTTQGSVNTNNNNNQNNNNNNNSRPNGPNLEFIKPWWTNGQQAVGEGPISNLVGKVRFIPVHRSKAILVLAPPEYRDHIEKMIYELDQPGKQVLIKAIIMQVGQRELQSLGTKISSNPAAFGDIGENVLTGLTQVTKVMGDFSISADINLLVDLLKKEADAKIINQPLLWTMDNEEAEFFRGDRIAFKVNERVTDQNNVISDFDYRNVGASLRVRPNITPDNSVNMTISLEISSVDPELVNGSIAVDLVNTTTRMNVKDGETVLLGGIVFKSNSLIKTGIPGLSKIPLLGYLFKNKKKEDSQSELLVFITPIVVDGSDDLKDQSLLKEKFMLLDKTMNGFEKKE